ncbi:LOW QUALITY PROTEIN: hypothetical protein T265_12820 [Opisthorchis viverrini]|uniref:Uncharacterized protein n=1 Tax=Opisthorchis viverrini TaxID=6198 RepID=A0A075AIW8_OPIVI|nr:LOW QUALITY PROTEIN: hypothetical protein T265_12820 [Opisthorchis viverrini]KER32359.1 LOW QUALITY PROTEIN: hypothetical protein T265_12820 [Opisthorchis viverrini]
MDPMVTLVGNGAEMKPFLQEEKTLAFWQVQFLAILGLDTGSLHRSQMTIFVLMYLLITSGHSRSLLDILENHSFLLTAVMVSIVSEKIHNCLDVQVERKVNVNWGSASSCSFLSVADCHAARKKHEGWDTARLPKPRQGKSRGRGQVRNMGFSVRALTTEPSPPSGSVPTGDPLKE